MEQGRFAEAVKKAERKLQETGDLVKLRHELDYSMDGDPLVRFYVVVPNASIKKGKRLEMMNHVSFLVERELQPQSRWGVYPLYRWRSKTEYEALQEPAFA